MAKQFSHGSFETKHFDICPAAVTSFDKSAKGKDVDAKAVVKAARAVDKYLGMEKAAQERGSVTDAQMQKFMDSVEEAKEAIRDAGLKGHNYHSTHISAMKRIDKNSKKDLKEGHDVEHEDHEADMARAQLMKTAEYAIKLFKMIEPGDNLEGWTAAKITKASDYLSSVFHYMEYEMYKETEKSRMMAMKDVKDDYFESLEKRLEESLNEKSKGLYYYVNKRKKAGTSRPKGHKDAPTDQDWKNAAKTAKEGVEAKCSDCGNPSWKTLPEEKQKGVDGKVCWKGYKRMGTKQKGGKTVDNCVKM